MTENNEIPIIETTERPKKPPITIEVKRQIWDLRQKFWTYEAIGEKLGISRQAVEQAMRRMTRDYAKRHEDDIDRIKAEQVAEHEHIAFEAYSAWEKSKSSYMQQKKKYMTVNGVGTGAIEHTDVPIVCHGDPRYLDMVMKAKDAIRKIVGADAPFKIDTRLKEFSELSDEELRKIALGENEPDAENGNDGAGGAEETEG